MRRQSLTTVAAIGAATLIALSCSTDPTAPTAAPLPAGMVVAAGNWQSGVMGAQLRTPISVKVTDADGAALPGAVVGFAVTSGGGHLAAASITSDDQGLASTTWTLGSGADAVRQSVAATVPGHSVTFTASGTALVAIQSGDHQTAEVAHPVGLAPTVIVRDAAHLPVPGLIVRWVVTEGGGSVSMSESTTDASGVASTAWTIGPTVGTGVHVLAATVPNSATAEFSASGVLTAGTLAISRGDRQSGIPNDHLPIAPAVKVTTPGPAGVPVSGVLVHWSVAAGGGTISEDVTATDIKGMTETSWTIGASIGANSQQLSASVSGLPATAVVFMASTTSPPLSIVQVSGDFQVGVAGTALPEPLVVRVVDSLGLPVAGVIVRWEGLASVLWGEGTPSSWSTTTDLTGQASVIYTLGEWVRSGAEVAAHVNPCEGTQMSCGFLSAPFTATTLAGPAARVSQYLGSGQSAVVGTALPAPISVRVEDAFGNGVSGVTVLWAATAGSGGTTVASSVTDASGVASTGWTVGTTVGTNNQIATATVPGLAGSPLTFTASATAGP